MDVLESKLTSQRGVVLAHHNFKLAIKNFYHNYTKVFPTR